MRQGCEPSRAFLKRPAGLAPIAGRGGRQEKLIAAPALEGIFEDEIDILNRAGDLGWKLVAIISLFQAVLKRPRGVASARADSRPCAHLRFSIGPVSFRIPKVCAALLRSRPRECVQKR